ncbi:MAG TPA: phosphoribosyltransferase family protein [Bacteroidales bacterium]|nr:phosphoribosyltransferase family protein [Bacteroidales bacterium]HPI87362.1 phosphoribosyltransferase family protein [Bacteroidales bacterium]HPM92648.1 phosphoribosyltransferase family protein [Bacteroidales bacterium]
MKTITVKDKTFKLSITADEISQAIDRLAAELNRDLEGRNPLFLVVLNGAFIFAADLYRKITIESEISFVKLASYSGTSSTSDVKELIGLNERLKGRNIVILEDIIDTGTTMQYLINKLYYLGVNDVKLAALLFKPGAFRESFRIDYLGMEIPNEFIVGYGLDYDGFGRNYADIYKIC